VNNLPLKSLWLLRLKRNDGNYNFKKTGLYYFQTSSRHLKNFIYAYAYWEQNAPIKLTAEEGATFGSKCIVIHSLPSSCTAFSQAFAVN